MRSPQGKPPDLANAAGTRACFIPLSLASLGWRKKKMGGLSFFFGGGKLDLPQARLLDAA
jgi:hypothetical protein